MLNIKVDALKAEIEELAGEFYICFYGLETEIKLNLTIEKENLQETIDFKNEYIDRIIHNNIF